MTKHSRLIFLALGTALLQAGSAAPAFAGATIDPREPAVAVHDGLVSVTADEVPLGDLVQAIATEYGLRLVQHADLDRIVTLRVERQPLHEVLNEALRNDSYQLYLATAGDDPEAEQPIPGTLWIFVEGAARAPAATVFLEAVLYQGTTREKHRAIGELQRLGTPAAVQALSLALSDENERVRGRAFEALETIGGEDAMAAIASAALDGDPWVRAEAAAALAAGDAETSAAYLATAMNDPDPRVRMAVIEALADVPFGTVPSRHAVDALYRALEDGNPEVRMQAFESLEEIGGDIAFQALMRAQRGADGDIADAARESLSSMEH